MQRVINKPLLYLKISVIIFLNKIILKMKKTTIHKAIFWVSIIVSVVSFITDKSFETMAVNLFLLGMVMLSSTETVIAIKTEMTGKISTPAMLVAGSGMLLVMLCIARAQPQTEQKIKIFFSLAAILISIVIFLYNKYIDKLLKLIDLKKNLQKNS